MRRSCMLNAQKIYNSPERCNPFGCPAPFPKLFSAGVPAPACVCWSHTVAGDSSPTVPSGPLSAGDMETIQDYAISNSKKVIRIFLLTFIALRYRFKVTFFFKHFRMGRT